MTDSAEDSKEKESKPSLEHIGLVNSSSQKLNRWLEQVNSKRKVRIARRDLLNWWIMRSPENLPNSELNAIIEEFYDEEVFLRQLLREVKKAKKEGKTERSLDLYIRPKKNETKKDSSPSESEIFHETLDDVVDVPEPKE